MFRFKRFVETVVFIVLGGLYLVSFMWTRDTKKGY